MQHSEQNEHIVLIWFIIGLLLVLIISIAFLILLKINHKKHLDTQHQIKTLNQQHHKKLQLSSIAIQEEERQRIGSDLHDSVINSLNILFLQSQAKQDEQVLVDGIQETILLTRRISHGLNPPLLEYAPLDNLVQDFFQQWASFYKINLTIDKQIQDELSTEQKMHLLRIVQELMNNVHKHAKASQIDFHLRLSLHIVAFSIRDNGLGFSLKDKGSGLGLQSIQLRTTLLNAKCKYKSQPNTGTTFLFLLPLTTT